MNFVRLSYRFLLHIEQKWFGHAISANGMHVKVIHIVPIVHGTMQIAIIDASQVYVTTVGEHDAIGFQPLISCSDNRFQRHFVMMVITVKQNKIGKKHS